MYSLTQKEHLRVTSKRRLIQALLFLPVFAIGAVGLFVLLPMLLSMTLASAIAGILVVTIFSLALCTVSLINMARASLSFYENASMNANENQKIIARNDYRDRIEQRDTNKEDLDSLLNSQEFRLLFSIEDSMTTAIALRSRLVNEYLDAGNLDKALFLLDHISSDETKEAEKAFTEGCKKLNDRLTPPYYSRILPLFVSKNVIHDEIKLLKVLDCLNILVGNQWGKLLEAVIKFPLMLSNGTDCVKFNLKRKYGNPIERASMNMQEIILKEYDQPAAPIQIPVVSEKADIAATPGLDIPHLFPNLTPPPTRPDFT